MKLRSCDIHEMHFCACFDPVSLSRVDMAMVGLSGNMVFCDDELRQGPKGKATEPTPPRITSQLQSRLVPGKQKQSVAGGYQT